MAPIELSNLSSNWKLLQKRLPAAPPSTPSAKPESADSKSSLKRKRSTNPPGENAHGSTPSVNGTPKKSPHKPSAPRKRQKMEEPASIGASSKHQRTKWLPRSASMPSLKDTASPPPASVLEPSAHHPDIENEGTSSTALPGKYVALDCEMVGTGPEPDRDSALARVSVVNYHGHQVYDSYVQVKVPVTDFRTAVSGIEPKHVRKDYARSFKEVHADMKLLLGGRILVGHAVKHDLDALILKHDRRNVRDTSKFSKFRELAAIPGRTPSLKLLAEKLLGVEIQVGAHSSVEDARATMALFRLEKEGFDQEVIRLYGHVRAGAAAAAVAAAAAASADVEDGEQVKKKSKNNKKKKKKKH